MNKEQFDKLEKQLIERGYKKYVQHWHHEDYMLGKSFHREDNQWDEGRAGCQLLLCIYDYTLHPEFFDRTSKEQRDHVGIEIHVDVSRIMDERMDFTTNWDDNTSIEESERLAESFYQWVCKEYPEPRKTY